MSIVMWQCQNIIKTVPKFCYYATRNFGNSHTFHKSSRQLLNTIRYKCCTVKLQSRCYYALIKTNDYICCDNNSASIIKQYCNGDKKETLLNADKNVTRRKVLENVIKHNKEVFRETEQRFREKSNVLMQDIKATKDKMKERMEVVIERENIYTIPNFLCVSRIAVTPYLGMLIVQSNFDLALVVLGLAAFTDLLDGWIARTWTSQSSKVGSFLDPMADKILISTLFLTLTYNDLIPFALTALIIARDVILVVAGFVIRYKSLPPPRTLTRYFDASHATAQLAPTFISKTNTVVQLLLVGSTLAAPVFHYVDHPVLQCLWYITGATTVAAGLSYVISKDTYKFLKKSR